MVILEKNMSEQTMVDILIISLKKNTKYLIESVVIIEGSNKKKDNYAKWHSLWTSYTLKTPNK